MKGKLYSSYIACVLSFFVFLGMYLYHDYHNYCDASVPIFAYHRVGMKGDLYSISPDDFKEQMGYLYKKGYKTVTLGEYAKMREEGKEFHKTIVLTFDDGYSDNLTAAVPIMEKYNYVGSVYLAIKFFGWPGYLTWQETQELVKAGWEVGSHTYNHVELGKIEDSEIIKKELVDSQAFTRTLYNKKYITLCYPSGSYNANVCALAQKTGYAAALTGNIGVNTKTTPIYELKRVNVFNNGKGLDGFVKKLNKAYLIGWLESYGVDAPSLWRKLKGI